MRASGDEMMMIKLKHVFLTGTAALGLALLPVAHGQQTASIQGHAQDEVGAPVKDGEVRITNDLNTPADKRKYLYTFKTDANGDYKGDGIAPGTYLVNLFRSNTSVDFQTDQTFKAGENKTENFDMSRPEYIAKETPERRKAIEDFKAKNAAAQQGNKAIANLNGTLAAVRADLKSPSPNFDKDITDSKSAVDTRPAEPILWVLYGEALVGKAKAGAVEDRKNKVSPTTDDAVTKSYSDGIDAYKKAIDLYAADPKKGTPEIQSTVYNEMGNALADSGKTTDAAAAYDKAVSLQPGSAGTFYANESAVFFNAHQDQPALDAADKAITADPTKAAPYFVKGQVLLGKATVDKAGKIVPPPGCVDAYQKYLELAPDGPQAPAVRDTLTALGEKVQTHYVAGKKGK